MSRQVSAETAVVIASIINQRISFHGFFPLDISRGRRS
jgi:hypothetical protein